MFEQLDGQIAVKDSSSKPAPLVSQDDMRNYQDSLSKKIPAQPPFVLEFTDPFGHGQSGDHQNNDAVSKPKIPVDGGVKKPVKPADGGPKKPAPIDTTGDELKKPEPLEGSAEVTGKGSLQQRIDTEGDGAVLDENKPAEPRDGGLKEKILGSDEGLVFDESKPVEPKDGGEKSPLVCTPEDSTGLGIDLPPIEFVDPRVEEARRRLERIERADQ